jgi:polyisoprenoid-binding protein YceI
MKFPVRLAVLALSLGLAAPSFAAPKTFRLDPAHTVVGFSVRHFFSKVPGRFNQFEGTIQLDEQNWGASSVEATIQAASIYTNQERRDNHLRSADFFDVEKFPTLNFKSTKITPGADNTLQVAGDLTIHGVTKPAVLDVSFLGSGPVSIGGKGSMERAGFEATTKVNRKDFGLVWNRTLDQGGTMLGDDVTINIQVEAMDAAAMKPPDAAAKPVAEKEAATTKK